MTDWVVAILLCAGSAFSVLASLGLVRLPDLYTRMQAATKAGTLGLGLVAVAVAVRFGTLAVAAWALLVVLFVFLTAPVAAHVIARAAYGVGIELWQGTLRDERRQPPPPANGS